MTTQNEKTPAPLTESEARLQRTQGAFRSADAMIGEDRAEGNRTDLKSGPSTRAAAWMTGDGRVISDAQKQQALHDGGASASSVKPYSIPLGLLDAVPAMAAEAVTIPEPSDDGRRRAANATGTRYLPVRFLRNVAAGAARRVTR